MAPYLFAPVRSVPVSRAASGVNIGHGHTSLYIAAMHLASYLDPVCPALAQVAESPAQLGAALLLHQVELPTLAEVKVALLALPSNHYSSWQDLASVDDVAHLSIAAQEVYDQSTHWADAIRVQLYGLYSGPKLPLVADLGNLKPGPTPDQTSTRLQHVAETLHAMGIHLICMGDDQSLTTALVKAAQAIHSQPIKLTVVDKKPDMDFEQGAGAHSFLNEVLIGLKHPLADLALLGYQTYLSDPAHLYVLEQSAYATLRLGMAKENTMALEPALRQSHVLSIDAGAMIIPAMSRKGGAFGLSTHEFCRLCWLAGHAPELYSAGLFMDMPMVGMLDLMAETMATAIWHMLEAYNQRPGFHELKSYNLLVEGYEQVCFYQEPENNSWWVSSPHDKYGTLLYACTEADYHAALQGDITTAMVRIFNRLALLK